MIKKPSIDSKEIDLLEFVHQWVKMCANGKIVEAFSLLDSPIDESRYLWKPEDIKEITYDHFDDGKYPTITDPDEVDGNIRKDVFAYNDGSGWGVEYDLPMNGVVSDFTLMFDFIKCSDELKVILDDCHVM